MCQTIGLFQCRHAGRGWGSNHNEGLLGYKLHLSMQQATSLFNQTLLMGDGETKKSCELRL